MKKFLIFLMFFPMSVYSQNPDIRFLRFINSQQSLSSDNFFKFASTSNNYVIASIPVGLGIAGLIKHDDTLLKNACLIIASNAVSFGITNGLKYSVNRKRPFVTYPDIIPKIDEEGPSFPSGHTSSAFATATMLSLSYPKWYIVVPSYIWAGSVGYSRMHLGVHYPGDVLGGMIVGAGSAYITFEVNKWLNRKYKMKHGL